MKYNNDSTEVVFLSYEGTEKTIPVSVLEALGELQISRYEVEDLLAFHRLGKLGAVDGKAVAPRKAKVRDLVGEDLTGLQVSFTTGGGWGERGWEHTSTEIVSVVPADNEEYFRFTFGRWDEVLETMNAAETDEAFNELYVALPFSVSDVENMHLPGDEIVTIVTLADK